MLSAGQHTLTNQPDGEDSSKICILVKLTDSSVKAIEEFLKNKNNTLKKPTIQFFQRDKGEFILPIENTSKSQPGSAESGYQLKNFFFALSSVKESGKDTSASSECICYNSSKLKAVATIDQKLNVQANDEVFLATKEKVNSGVEEEKKNSTKEIKPSGMIGNRSTPYGSNLANSSINRAKQQAIVASKTNLNTSLEAASKPRPPVIDRPLRERLIHLLAVKPYNRAEILLKLHKDSLNERDKDNLDSILQSVAILNPKNNSYELSNEVILNEVKDDWQFYSQTEKAHVTRVINKAKQGPQIQSTTPSSQSTTSSTNYSSFSGQVSGQKNMFNVNVNTSKTSTSSMPVKDRLFEIEANELNECSKNYKKIQNIQQKEKYLDDFNKYYTEYEELHNYLEDLKAKYYGFQQELRSKDDSSNEYQETKQRIISDYLKTQSDSEHIKKKERHAQLYAKLKHIQDLLKDVSSTE